MVTRELLIDAVTQCLRAGFGSTNLMQRRVRVGFVTAEQLLYALEDGRVLGPYDPGSGRWPALHRKDELPAAVAEIDAAIADGRITLT